MDSGLYELLRLSLPGLLVLMSTVILFLLIYRKDRQRFAHVRFLARQKTILPLRLQAYERLLLLLERLKPEQLLLRIRPADLLAREYQLELIKTVKSEFEHNISQQLYVGVKTWNAILVVREDLLKTIHLVGSAMPNEASGSDLARALLKHYMEEVDELPHTSAINLLKEEAASLF